MFDITKRRASETAQIDLVTGEGAPLTDDDGNQLKVTIYGPGSKVWQAADAEKRRRATLRVEKNRGRLSAAVDSTGEDDLDFLRDITVSFDGWSYPAPDDGQWSGQKDMFRAAYADDSIGYIRDHVLKEANDWSAFTRGSAKS